MLNSCRFVLCVVVVVLLLLWSRPGPPRPAHSGHLPRRGGAVPGAAATKSVWGEININLKNVKICERRTKKTEQSFTSSGAQVVMKVMKMRWVGGRGSRFSPAGRATRAPGAPSAPSGFSQLQLQPSGGSAPVTPPVVPRAAPPPPPPPPPYSMSSHPFSSQVWWLTRNTRFQNKSIF